ncbi:MAG: NAD(P)H-quinone oxidoreductase [Alphaproteobacteria bacterium]|nr:NAD(P)H-quinone oxidoreductase [Alphaproteobacteria bacterium]
MKAIAIKDEALVPVEIPRPEPREGELLIRVRAAGVNRPDILQRQGLYPPPPGVTDIPGLEVAGIVEGTGARVCALLTGGGYAEYACAPSSQCLPIPEGMSFEEAAALPECVFTVWNNIFELGKFQPGETVLIHGGSSGIGTTAIQMVKAFGGRAIATAGSEDKCAACLSLGAVLAVNYKTQDFVQEILDFTDGRGVDIVLDMVGGDYVRRNLEILAEGGRHVSIAFLKEAKTEIVIPVIMKKRLTLTGSQLRSRPESEKAALATAILQHVWPRIERGEIRPLIHQIYPLAEAAQAHALLETGQHIGKIVLKV